MKNMIEVLKKAREKKVFKNNEFKELLIKIQLMDPNLKLDWDDGAGEEWARFFEQESGVVCMISARLAVAFIRKSYEFSKIQNIMDMMEIVYTEDYSSNNWYINMANFKKEIPELYWHASEEAVNIDSFSLDDLYFATI